MLLKYIDDFNKLKELGFKTDLLNTYWFLPYMPKNHSLIIDIETREIECGDYEDLKIIEGLYESINL